MTQIGSRDGTYAPEEGELYGHAGLSAAEIDELAVLEPQSVHIAWSECPVHRMKGGGVLVTGMREIGSICRRNDMAGPSATAPIFGTEEPVIPFELDGPEHRAYRRLLDPHFSPAALARWEPEIRRLADELIDGFIDDGQVDIYDAFCQVLPATIFLRLMGFSMHDYDELIEYKEEVIRVDLRESQEETDERRRRVTRRFHAKVAEHVEARRASSERTDDMLGELMYGEVEGETLGFEAILHTATMLVIAGLDTVAAALSLQLNWLARHSEERRALVAAPERWATAVEELLRYETVAPFGRRYPANDVEVDGVPVGAGELLTLSWASANLDPAVFAEPLDVDLDRKPNRHATFGIGPHHCLGMHLARLELRTVLDQFHRRIPDYAIAPGAEVGIIPTPVRIIRPLPLIWRDIS